MHQVRSGFDTRPTEKFCPRDSTRNSNNEVLLHSVLPCETAPTSPAPDVHHFEIAPGESAQHAEVTVDRTQDHISIYVYRS